MLELIIIVRCSKLANLTYEIKTMRIIMETISNLATPFLNLFFMLFITIYIFAIIGMFLFGGLNYKGNPQISKFGYPENYYMMNFNDLPVSMMTLFHQLIVNNWFCTMQIFIGAYGGSYWVSVYFILFYYFSVLICFNLIIAFTLDMYASVENIDNERVQAMNLIQKEFETEAKKAKGANQ